MNTVILILTLVALAGIVAWWLYQLYHGLKGQQ